MDLRTYLIARKQLDSLIESKWHGWSAAQRADAKAAAVELEEERKAFPWVPFPGPQTEAVLTLADETLYGGAAAGGKTQILIGLAIMQHRKTLILREHSTELAEIKEKLLLCAGHLGTWKSIGPYGGSFLFNDGRTIELGGYESVDAFSKYAGRPHDLIALDEGGDLPKSVMNLLAWNRSDDKSQRCRLVIASNPPRKADNRWLIDYYAPWVDRQFPNPALPGELRWFVTVEDCVEWVDGPEPVIRRGKALRPRSRTFLPAKIADNPTYATDADYLARLQALPETLRKQLEEGDFTAGMEDDAWQCIPTAWVVAAQQRWLEHVRQHGEKPPEGQALSAVGADIAWGGADRTCVSARYGVFFAHVKKYKGVVTDSGAKAADLVLREHDGNAPVNVDVIGIGASCYDHLKARIGGLAKAINVSASPNPPQFDRSKKYALPNYRSVAYWKLREALDPNTGDNLMLPPDPELLADLTAPTYEPRASGIYIEPKDRIQARIGRSPDCGDAVALSHLQGPRLRKFSIGL